MRVLGQFDIEIDRSNLTSAIKCWYLKEFVDPKVEYSLMICHLLQRNIVKSKVFILQNLQVQVKFHENSLHTLIFWTLRETFRTSMSVSDLLWMNLLHKWRPILKQ